MSYHVTYKGEAHSPSGQVVQVSQGGQGCLDPHLSQGGPKKANPSRQEGPSLSAPGLLAEPRLLFRDPSPHRPRVLLGWGSGAEKWLLRAAWSLSPGAARRQRAILPWDWGLPPGSPGGVKSPWASPLQTPPQSLWWASCYPARLEGTPHGSNSALSFFLLKTLRKCQGAS